ncbi:glutathione peroxidase [Myroides guanonis]|uniref:Glutathione peroxidase n=1 Tax=Myroides guanonis TaxID=1150112 RepID=A0A1I3LCR8_9FLAO|nr:glutathione peroxidase [Myroides guanonis]SFI82296.1 glutathione peroxidase [Myroides guanonis]
MKNYIILAAFLSCLTSSIAQENNTITNNIIMKNTKEQSQSIYQFKVKDIHGKDFDFATLAGKKVIIVNTASECGLTPQYKQLQSLYKEFQDKNLVIIGFPANNFGNQEPGSDSDISTFCEANYGVSFPMMSKISVKGNDIHPIYQFLTQKDKNGVTDSEVEWNFQKYLIDENGHLAKVISPRTLPTDDEIKNWIKGIE